VQEKKTTRKVDNNAKPKISNAVFHSLRSDDHRPHLGPNFTYYEHFSH